MCLTIPVEIVEIDDESGTAIVWLDGIRKQVSIELLEDPHVGQMVLVHVGYAIGVLHTDDANRTLAAFAELVNNEDALATAH
jgi:hydrogenase expression/formation protein HypC